MQAVAGLVAACLVAGIQVKAVRLVPVVLGGLLAVFAVRWLSLHARTALVSLFVFVPLQQPVLAYAYSRGVPGTVVRYLGFYKELVVLAVVVAAVRAGRSQPRPLRRADVLALVFIAMTLAFVVIQLVFPGALGNQSLSVLLGAFRLNCLFLILFVACRRLRWTTRDLEVLGWTVLVPALAMVGPVLWERYATDSFSRFTLQTLHLRTYLHEVIGLDLKNAFGTVLSPLNGTGAIRPGGWLYNPLELGFFLVLPLTLAFRNQVRSRTGVAGWLVTGLLGSALLLTLTRSSVLAAGVALALLLFAAGHYQLAGRVKLLLLTLVGCLVLGPFVAQSTFVQRVASSVKGTDSSTAAHSSSSSSALELMLSHPAGQGLGSNPVTALREQTHGITSENAYLQIGNELGVIPLLVFLVLVGATQAELRRAARRHREIGVRTVVWAAGWGLAVNGLFLHVWLSLPVALTFWAMAGAASAADDEHAVAPDPREEALVLAS